MTEIVIASFFSVHVTAMSSGSGMLTEAKSMHGHQSNVGFGMVERVINGVVIGGEVQAIGVCCCSED
jgi:hypothetical protein